MQWRCRSLLHVRPYSAINLIEIFSEHRRVIAVSPACQYKITTKQVLIPLTPKSKELTIILRKE